MPCIAALCHNRAAAASTTANAHAVQSGMVDAIRGAGKVWSFESASAVHGVNVLSAGDCVAACARDLTFATLAGLA